MNDTQPKSHWGDAQQFAGGKAKNMIPQNKKALKEASPYTGVITREQFLFYEMRTTARLVEEKLTDAEIADRICNENLFQYPTEKSVRQMAFTCIRRVKALDDPVLFQ